MHFIQSIRPGGGFRTVPRLRAGRGHTLALPASGRQARSAWPRPTLGYFSEVARRARHEPCTPQEPTMHARSTPAKCKWAPGQQRQTAPDSTRDHHRQAASTQLSRASSTVPVPVSVPVHPSTTSSPLPPLAHSVTPHLTRLPASVSLCSLVANASRPLSTSPVSQPQPKHPEPSHRHDPIPTPAHSSNRGLHRVTPDASTPGSAAIPSPWARTAAFIAATPGPSAAFDRATATSSAPWLCEASARPGTTNEQTHTTTNGTSR